MLICCQHARVPRCAEQAVAACTDQHHRLARLPSALENALRGRRIARAINVASGFRRPLTAVAVAWQSTCRAQLGQEFEQERRLFVAASMALPTAVTVAVS